MAKLKVLDLFSGIGGFSLGLERTGGFETVAFCEIEEFPRRVLAKHWPDVPCYDDVRTLTSDRLAADGIAVDVICGGFPCQDISNAGKRAGLGTGTRSGLWSEIDRLAGELGPEYIVLENVTGLLSGPTEQPGGWFGRVLGDLAKRGYNAEWQIIRARDIGFPHVRPRVWIIAHSDKNRSSERKHVSSIGEKKIKKAWRGEIDGVASSQGSSCPECGEFALGCEAGRMGRFFQPISWHRDRSPTSEPVLGRGTHGIPNRVDRCRALGNAVVPQIPELIGRAILASMETA